MAREWVSVGYTFDEMINEKTGRECEGHTLDCSGAIRAAGGLPRPMPITDDPEEIRGHYDACDAIVITGGLDINPSKYDGGLEGLDSANNGSIKNDDMALRIVELARRERKPILGICRGAEVINIALDGTLLQHLPDDVGTEIDHRASHKVLIKPGTFLESLIGNEEDNAISRHHQAIKKLGNGLIVNAVAEDGVIEGIESSDPNHWMLAVQWHEEEMGTNRIFLPLVQAGARYRAGGHLSEAA